MGGGYWTGIDDKQNIKHYKILNNICLDYEK